MWDYGTLHFQLKQSLLAAQVSPRNCRQLDAEDLAKRKANRKAAIALCWDSSSVTVRCPFCQNQHTHKISFFAHDIVSDRLKSDSNGRFEYYGPSDDRCESRVADCYSDIPIELNYTILFPFENDPRVAGLSFEIESLPTDQTRGSNGHNHRFRTIGLGLEPLPIVRMSQTHWGHESKSEQELTRRMDGMQINQCIPSLSQEELVTGACDGSLPEIKQSTASSSWNTELANARGPNGSSLLALATQNGHISTVRYLLEHGVDINSSDQRGRTPLMEAALWGYAQILYILLEHGADRHRKDMDSLQAYDFGTESDQNDKERSERHIQYREDPFVMKRQRKLIRNLLREETSKHPNNALVLGVLPDTHFCKSSGAGTVSLVVPAWGTPIAKQHKTVAILNRGGPFPLLQAISGWDGAGLKESHCSQANFETLDAKYWQSEAFEIASAIGFSFKPHKCDDSGLPGSYYASHAEIQLMCFFISRNYIFREYEPGQTVDDDFLQLFLLQERNRHSEIAISSPPCDSCSAFAKQTLHALDITFKLSPLDEGKKFWCPSCGEAWHGRIASKQSYYCVNCGKEDKAWKFRPFY